MVAVGYAVMPVIPSFDNISRDIEKKISGPLSKASEQAGDALEKGVGAKIDQLGDRAERSAFRQKKAQDELTAATSKRERAVLSEQAAQQKLEAAVNAVGVAQDKATRSVDAALDSYEKLRKSGTASAEELAAAEQKIADARARGQADVERREIAVTNARKGVVSATQGVVDAENGYVRALRESERASEAAEAAAREYADAQERGITAMDRVRDSASRMGSSIAEAAEKYKVHATVALGAIGALGKGAMDYASEAEQSYGAVESIFGAHADAITAKSKEAAEAVGLSGREYRELSSLTGAMLKNMGMPMDEVTGKTQELVAVASDLSATFGGSTKDAIEAVNALLRGEADPIERYGVSIKKTDVNARLAAKGLSDLEGEALKQAEAQELLAMLMEQTADAQGQFARETDTAAHKQQVATAKMNDAREVIGMALLPVMADLMDVGARVAEVIGEHPRLFLAIAGAVGTLAAGVVALGTIAPIFTALAGAASAAGMSMWGYVAAQAAAIAPIAAVVAGIAVLTGGLVYFFKKTETGQEIWQNFTDKIKLGIEAVQVAWGELTAAFQGEDWGYGQLAEWFGEDRAQSVVNGVAAVGEAFRDMRDLAQGVADILFRGDYTGLPFGLEEDSAAVGVLFSIRDAVVATWDALKNMAGDVAGSVLSVLGSLWEVVKAVGGALWDVAQAVAPVLIPVLKVVAGLVGGVLLVAFHALMGAIRVTAGVIEGLAQAFAWVVENAIAPFISAIAGVVSWVAEKLPVAISAAAGWLQSAFQAIGGFFQGMGSAMKAVWDGVILPVFNAFVTAGQWLVTILTTMVLTPLILAWEAMSWAVQAAWANIIKPTWDALASGAQWLWQNVLLPAFDGIKWAFEQMGTGLQWVFDNILKPVFDGFVWLAQQAWNGAVIVFDGIKWAFQSLADGLRWVYDNVIQPVWDVFLWGAQSVWDGVNVIFGFISAGWQFLADGLRLVYDSIIQPVWDAFGAGLTWLHDNVVAPVTSWIGDKWRLMGDGFNVVKNFVVDTVFGGLKSGLDTLQGWFQTAVDGIRSIWDGIKRATAAPVKFVVETVYNNGIRKAWNLVSKFTGLDELEEAQLGSLGAYAHGGVLPGYTPGRDPYTFVEPRTGMSIGLSGGEAIVRPEATRVLGSDWVDGINTAARMGGEKGVARFLGGFANGGVIGSITRVVRENFPMMTITSTYRPGDPGHHGTGNAVDFSNGTDTTPAMQAAAKFFHDNYGPGLFELIHSPSPFNIKNGRNVGDGFGLYGAGTMNAHRNHVHIASPNPLGDPTTFVDMADFDGAGGSWFNPMTWVKKAWDEVVDHMPSWDGPGLIGGLPGAMLKKMASAAWETVKSAAEKFAGAFTGNGGSAGSAESWREMAMWAMRREGFNADDPAQVNAMLAQIMSESGGNPGIAQQIVDVNGTGESAGVGLLQIIPGTFAAYRDPSLPDDRRDPEANMVAALRYYKARYGTDLTTTWGHGHGYASGGVLPGYTPGRDVHQFFSPTGGALALSGGEAIMVPEWTRAVGGPAAVAAMNRAARAGRTSGGPGFADGGVFGATGNALTWDGLVSALRNEQWTQAIVDAQKQLEKIADYNSVEGVAARSLASEMADIAGMLGGKTVSTVATSLLDAEKRIWDARAGSADRLATVAEKEKALEEARKAAADAASAEMSEESKKRIADAEEALTKAREDGNADKVAEAEKKLADVRKEVSEKSAEDVTKANEQVVKAEQELASARKAAAQALDVRIFDLAPQINGMLLQAAAATAAVPALSGALGGLAAAVGPAGITVGVVLQAVKIGIATVKKVGAAISDFVTRIIDARGKTYANMVTVTNLQHEWAKMVDEQASKVAELRVAWVEAQVALRDATWKTRLAQADVVRAQLQGVKSVAEAEAKLEAERNRAARAALRNFDDLSLAYDRYRWAEHRGMVERLELQAAVTPEILALESEVNAARLNALASQKEASLSALQASWEQQKAALDLMQTQQNLALQTQQLAVMQREFFGMSQAESLQAMNTMKLRQELAEVQSQQGKNFWRLSYWLTGAHRADELRERALREQIAGREGGVDSPRGAGAMAFFGYGDSALNAARNAGYGRAEQAMFEAQEQQALLQLEQQKQQLQQQIEQSRLFEQYQQQVGALTAEIESLQAGASAAQYTADYYREENTAVRAANLALAQFEADRSSQYAAVGRGEKQVVEITVPQQDVYTREQMDLVLRSVQEIPELEARIRKVEAPATPGANVAMRNLIGG